MRTRYLHGLAASELERGLVQLPHQPRDQDQVEQLDVVVIDVLLLVLLTESPVELVVDPDQSALPER